MGNQSNYTQGDTVDQFKAAMRDSGLTPPETITADGNLHRFKIDGKVNGAYVLHLDGRPSGYFQDFKQNIKESWKQAGNFNKPPSQFQYRASIVKCEQEAERQAKHKAAADKARYIWGKSSPAPADHPYLLAKRVKPHGLMIGWNNRLIVPIFDETNTLVSLQFIDGTGDKRFLSGGRKKGCFSVIGKPDGLSPILIAEGWATGASLHESTGHFTVVALDAGNLEPVAQVIRKLYPLAEIVICGDNDESAYSGPI